MNKENNCSGNHKSLRETCITTDEDFSFEKLKSTLKAFENKQKEHHHQQIFHDLNHKMTTERTGVLVDASQLGDFSYKTLKDKAMRLEKNNEVARFNKNKSEDFSFKTLKDKAVQLEKTSLKSKSNETVTPIKRKIDHHESILRTPPPSSNLKICPSTCPSRVNSSKLRFTNKMKSEEIQATNEKHASVKQLSKWLSDDPFDKKKELTIKKSEEIRLKAKMFESYDVILASSSTGTKLSTAQRERQHFPIGKVSQGKSWLQNAFGTMKDPEIVESISAECLTVSDKRKLFENELKKNNKPNVCH